MGCSSGKDLQALPPAVRGHLEKELGGTAEDYAECCVCFEPLCEDTCVALHGQLRGQMRRVCRHVLHERCARALMKDSTCGSCPECRQPFQALKPLPRLELNNLQAWFDAVDVDGDGKLSRMEVLQVLKAQYRLDWRKLEQHIATLWSQWDADGSGFIDFEELCAPGGLVQFITGHQVSVAFPAGPGACRAPSLQDTQQWFRYWDEDENGSLDIGEVQRALIKTFNLKDLRRIANMKEVLASTWPLFDPDGSQSIDYQEFTMGGGLGEALAASVTANPGSPHRGG